MSKKEHTTPETEETVKQEELPQAEDQQPEPQEEQAESDEDKLQEMGEKLATLNDKYLRLYSEYENYRKRTNVEKADLLLNGSREMMKAILPVVDDFERALAATGDDEGVKLIYNKLMKILEQKGLKASVSALTSEMKGLLKSWRLQHPKRVPDSVSYTFKVLRVRQQGRKDLYHSAK